MAVKSAIPVLPSSLPAINSNGVTEPRSTSLILLIFSSITLLSNCGALVMITKNKMNMSRAGTTADRIGSTFSAALIALFRPRRRSRDRPGPGCRGPPAD